MTNKSVLQLVCMIDKTHSKLLKLKIDFLKLQEKNSDLHYEIKTKYFFFKNTVVLQASFVLKSMMKELVTAGTKLTPCPTPIFSPLNPPRRPPPPVALSPWPDSTHSSITALIFCF